MASSYAMKSATFKVDVSNAEPTSSWHNNDHHHGIFGNSKHEHGLSAIQQSLDSATSGTSASGSGTSPTDKMGPWNVGLKLQAEPSVTSADGSVRPGSSSSHSHSQARRKSLPSFHRKFRNAKDASSISISVDQAWATLSEMSTSAECVLPLEVALLKQTSALTHMDQETNLRYSVDSRLGQLLQQILLTALEDFDENPFSEQERRDIMIGVLCPLIRFCLHLLQKGGHWIQFTILSTLNKIADMSLVLNLFNSVQLYFYSDCIVGKRKIADAPSGDLQQFFYTDAREQRLLAETDSAELAQASRTHSVEGVDDLLSAFKHVEPATTDVQHTKVLTLILDPTLDPQLLCLLLQAVALLAIETKTHTMFRELQIDDVLIQMLLPADDWYYTNHSTKFGQFVKHHAARILIYIGLGDRVGSRVNLFQFPGIGPEEPSVPASMYPVEDEYICKTCSTPVIGHSLLGSKAISLEGILAKILTELFIAGKRMSKDMHERKRSSEATLTGDTIAYHNLEAYLTRLACLVDPVILLRLILHKLSWDLGLIRKKQSTASKLYDGKQNTLMPGTFKKSKSFDRRAEASPKSLKPSDNPDGSKDKADGLAYKMSTVSNPATSSGLQAAPAGGRAQIRRTSSLKNLPRRATEKLKGNWHKLRDT